MTYESEVVIPVEIGLPTSQTNQFDTEENDHALTKHLDLVEENREIISMRLASYQHKISMGYNVRLREFIPENLVLRKVLGNTRDLMRGKLSPN